MKINIKKIIIVLCYLLIPSVLVSVLYHLPAEMTRIYLVVLYLITLAGIILFFVCKCYRSRLYKWILLLGFAVSPLYTFIIDARWVALARSLGGESLIVLPYLNTTFAVIFYALPFIIISSAILFAIFIVVVIKKGREIAADNEK